MNSNLNQTVLFCPIHPTSLAKMLYIAEYIKKVALANGVFIVSNAYINSNIEKITAQGMEPYFVGGFEKKQDFKKRVMKKESKLSWTNIKVVCYGWVKKVAISYFEKKEAAYIAKLQYDLKQKYRSMDIEVIKLFDELMPSSVVVAGDRHLNYETVIIHEARKRGINVVVPPISVIADPN